MATTIELVRLEIDDSSTPYVFDDPEVQIKLDEHGDNVKLAAADLLDILAIRYARDFDFETDGQVFKKGTRSATLAARAAALRGRATGGLSTIETTRIDGASDDISARSRERSVCQGDFDTRFP